MKQAVTHIKFFFVQLRPENKCAFRGILKCVPVFSEKQKRLSNSRITKPIKNQYICCDSRNCTKVNVAWKTETRKLWKLSLSYFRSARNILYCVEPHLVQLHVWLNKMQRMHAATFRVHLMSKLVFWLSCLPFFIVLHCQKGLTVPQSARHWKCQLRKTQIRKNLYSCRTLITTPISLLKPMSSSFGILRLREIWISRFQKRLDKSSAMIYRRFRKRSGRACSPSPQKTESGCLGRKRQLFPVAFNVFCPQIPWLVRKVFLVHVVSRLCILRHERYCFGCSFFPQKTMDCRNQINHNCIQCESVVFGVNPKTKAKRVTLLCLFLFHQGGNELVWWDLFLKVAVPPSQPRTATCTSREWTPPHERQLTSQWIPLNDCHLKALPLIWIALPVCQKENNFLSVQLKCSSCTILSLIGTYRITVTGGTVGWALRWTGFLKKYGAPMTNWNCRKSLGKILLPNENKNWISQDIDGQKRFMKAAAMVRKRKNSSYRTRFLLLGRWCRLLGCRCRSWLLGVFLVVFILLENTETVQAHFLSSSVPTQIIFSAKTVSKVMCLTEMHQKKKNSQMKILRKKKMNWTMTMIPAMSKQCPSRSSCCAGFCISLIFSFGAWVLNITKNVLNVLTFFFSSFFTSFFGGGFSSSDSDEDSDEDEDDDDDSFFTGFFSSF